MMLNIYLFLPLLVSLSAAYHVGRLSSQIIHLHSHLPRNQPLITPGVKKLNKGLVEHILLKNCSGVIDESTFKHFPKLKKLTLWKTHIEEINSSLPITQLVALASRLPPLNKNYRQKLPNLESALLLGNKDFLIDPSALKNFKNLRTLHISEANFTDDCITKEWFRGLDHLQDLSLSDNNLSCIAEDAFKSSSNIWKLDLTYNHIKNLEKTVFKKLTKLELLGLYGNELEGFDIGLLGSQRAHLEVLGVDWKDLKGVRAEDVLRNLPKLRYVSFGHEEMPNDFKAGEFCQVLRQHGAQCEVDTVFGSGRILGYSLT
ncbi:leucine-rich repeat-containing protein 15-like isoform X2 [Euwallacea fornicatus]|uniref:leucine-rich repeat-containing protein 15-like isoform X2 n=1 Tax=Euwallacea fornicatus TaxID=995702 RepID=UPI00338EAC9D